jgi:nucleoside-triphosphatase
MATSRHALLVTGAPGSGKTTALRAVAARLRDRRLGGFYTEEVRRRGGVRTGFRLGMFDGHAALLARVDRPGAPRVGKYGVDVAALDDVVDRVLATRGIDIHIVDEIGKMECLSPRFVSAMRRVLDRGRPCVASVARRGDGFIAEVKRRPDVEVWELTRANRDEVPGRILAWLGEVA